LKQLLLKFSIIYGLSPSFTFCKEVKN
jgi:hypothetical protein